MILSQLMNRIKNNRELQKNLTAWKVIPPQQGDERSFPSGIRPRLIAALKQRGIKSLYCHQAEAFEVVSRGQDCIIVTPTASGKSLCYNLPVLNTLLENREARAMYLFPTKALSQDQMNELHSLITELDADIKTYTYDGDTPQHARKPIREAGHIVVTNPDMLHTGILPHHTRWNKLFKQLEYVVIDEVHTYRGVFGSHVANVIRRLNRICRFYGQEPVFICCSATIANPDELAYRLTGREVHLIDQNGAPRGKKHFLFYNPPVINRELGIRRSSTLVSRDLAAMFLKNDIQTIVFTRSRVNTEILVTYLRDSMNRRKSGGGRIRGYRGGYLPRERRQIEKDLRSGQIKGVVSTNALELGIDIGRLQACVINGYPGTISSTWQQAGRAGRSSEEAVAVLVATSSPLDQYIISNPGYFFQQNPEHGLINPDNLIILLSHIKCAAFELPFRRNESFGEQDITEILEFLDEEGVLHFSGDRYHWMSEIFPAEDISLRSASSENFVIIDRTRSPQVIGEVDRFSAPMLIHQDAIYMHDGDQYQIEELDWEGKKAYAQRVDVDYYTDANLSVEVRVLEEFAGEEDKVGTGHSHGEVLVSALVTMFKKIRLHTHENVGSGHVNLPEQEMHTTAYWLSLPPGTAERMPPGELESGLSGLAHLLSNVAPVHLMCAPQDIRTVCQSRSPFTRRPTIFLYEAYPGGVGFSEKIYRVHDELMEMAYTLIRACGCEGGCPGCVGPAFQISQAGKESTLQILVSVLEETPVRQASPRPPSAGPEIHQLPPPGDGSTRER